MRKISLLLSLLLVSCGYKSVREEIVSISKTFCIPSINSRIILNGIWNGNNQQITFYDDTYSYKCKDYGHAITSDTGYYYISLDTILNLCNIDISSFYSYEMILSEDSISILVTNKPITTFYKSYATKSN